VSEVSLPILVAGVVLLLLVLFRSKATPRKAPRPADPGNKYWWVVPLCFLAGVGVAYLMLRR
jgi:hypothetical protein